MKKKYIKLVWPLHIRDYTLAISAVNWIFWNYSNLVISTQMREVILWKSYREKKWDQINRRGEVLEYKTHKCKNAMFSFTKRECLSKKRGTALSWASVVTQKRQAFILVVLLRRYLKWFSVNVFQFYNHDGHFLNVPHWTLFFLHVHTTANRRTSTTQFGVGRL